MKRFITTIALAVAITLGAAAQQRLSLEAGDETVRLWDNTTALHSNHETRDEAWRNKTKTSMQYTSSCELYIFKAEPSKNRGVAILMCPGGGYQHVGFHVHTAEWFASQGVTVALMKYRLPNGHREVPLEDATGALRYMRTRSDLGIDPAKVGVLGNSAGGHLASWLSNAMPDDEKPAFAILHYPAIDRTAALYLNTRKTTGALLGAAYSNAEAEAISTHNMVSRATPPTLLLLCDDDVAVPPTSPLAYYEALVRHGIRSSIHIFPKGGHSLKLSLEESRVLMYDWLDWLGITKK